MKINYLLLLKIVALEIIYSVALFFASFFFLWNYFGEGAGAESYRALLWGKIAMYIVVFPPIVFNLYKMLNFKKEAKQNFITYFIAEFIIVLFFVFGYSHGFIEI